MFKITLSAFVALVAFGLPSHTAWGQARVFVAAQGSDANACTFAAPCRTMQHAHDTVAPGGEIDVLDPAGYGALTINRAISIQGHGFAGISASSGNAVTIAAASTDAINLRGLLIDGAAGASINNNGIVFGSGGSLNIQDTLVRNFGGTGLLFQPAGSSVLVAVNSQFVANRNDGVQIAPTAGTVTGTLDNVVAASNRFDGVNVNGTGSSGSIQFTISDTTISNNQAGIVVQSSGASTKVMVRSTLLSNNAADGILSSGTGALVTVTKSTITYSDAAFIPLGGGGLVSFGDNTLANNGQDGTPTGTLSPK